MIIHWEYFVISLLSSSLLVTVIFLLKIANLNEGILYFNMELINSITKLQSIIGSMASDESGHTREVINKAIGGLSNNDKCH